MGLYNPYRVKTPLKRTNPEKGSDVDPGWVEISWEEALDTVAAQFKKIREEDPRKLVVWEGWGGGIFGYAWGPDARTIFMLNNNIITKNRAQYGAGIYCCSGKTCPVSEPGGLVTWTFCSSAE